jgi:hypothetical protein
MIPDCYNKDRPAVNLSPIDQLSGYKDLMATVLKSLGSPDALASRLVCQRWNELISTQCIVPILYKELEPQVSIFLEHIDKTLDQYFSARGIDLSSINSTKAAYYHLAPIKWNVSLGECLWAGDLTEITPTLISRIIQDHFLTANWGSDYKWRADFHKVLSNYGFPTSTWNQLALAYGVDVEEWNNQLKMQLLLESSISQFQVEKTLEKFGVVPGLQEPGFNLSSVVEKISELIHSKVGAAPYFQLCALEGTKPPAPADKFAFIDHYDNSFDDGSPITFFFINDKCFYNYFPCTVLGFKEEDYAEKDTLPLPGQDDDFPIDSMMGKDICFPINGRFFKFTICPGPHDPGALVEEVYDRDIHVNGWKCLLSSLYNPKDECKEGIAQ